MNAAPLNNCPGGTPAANPALSGLKNGFAGRIFSYFNFDKVIQDTLESDLVVTNVRQTSPYFGGSVFSYNNIVSNNLYYQYLNAYLATKVMYKRMETIRHQYLVAAVLQCLVDDALAMDPTTGEVFTVKVNDKHPYSKKANRLCEEFEKHFKIDRLINSVIEDAIFWGEYSMTLQSTKGTDLGTHNGTPGAGIQQIIDANPPGTIFGVWDGVHPKYFVRLMKGINTSVQGQLERLEPTSVWNIGIFPQKIRFSLGYGSWLYDDSNRIAQFFRIGKPLFYSVYDKILELEAFEQAQYQKELGDAKRRGLISVQAPAGLDLNQLRDFSRFYERLLNESNGPDNLNEITGLEAIRHMMSSLSQVRVVPLQPDRGRFTPVDIKIAQDNIAEKIADRRKIILEAIGVPFEYVFGQGTGGASGHKVNLRQYIRYCRRLKEIQDGIAWSVQRLYRTHLMDNGIDVKLDDITVHFYNTINIAEMDRLEFLDANVGMLKNLNEFLAMQLEHPVMSKYINVSEVARYYAKVINQMEGVGNIIVVPDGENIMGDEARRILQQEQMQQQGMGDPNAGGGEVPPEQQMPPPEQPAPQGNGLPSNLKIVKTDVPPNVKIVTDELPSNVQMIHEKILSEQEKKIADEVLKAQSVHESRIKRAESYKKKFGYN